MAPRHGSSPSSVGDHDGGKKPARPCLRRCRCGHGHIHPVLAMLASAAVLVVCVAARHYAAPLLAALRRWREVRDNAYVIHFPLPSGSLDIDGMCRAHGFRPRSGAPPPRVFDAIMFNRELELLELRLAELDSVVDVFIVVESERTHAGNPKPLVFAESKARFAQWAHKIVHVVHSTGAVDPIERETAMRREGYEEGLQKAGLAEGDLVIVADADEIPRATVIQTLKLCEGYPDNVVLSSRSYYLSFEFRHVADWHFPNVVVHRGRGGFLADFRTDKGVVIADAGWHCSFCFGDTERIVDKVGATRHVLDWHHASTLQAAGQPYAALYQAYCDGQDPLRGAWLRFEVQQSVEGLPAHVLSHFSEFRWLLPGQCGGGRGHADHTEPGRGVAAWDGRRRWYTDRGDTLVVEG